MVTDLKIWLEIYLCHWFSSFPITENSQKYKYISSVHGSLQARILEWVIIPFSNQEFSFSNPGIQPVSPALQVDYLPSEPPEKPFSF